MSLEPADLNMQVNLALVCSGKMCDLAKLREDIRRNHPGVKIVFNTMSAEYLFVLKKGNMLPEQINAFQKNMEKE